MLIKALLLYSGHSESRPRTKWNRATVDFIDPDLFFFLLLSPNVYVTAVRKATLRDSQCCLSEDQRSIDFSVQTRISIKGVSFRPAFSRG